MPSVSKKQRIAMAIACHRPGKSRANIPQTVGCEFNAADKAKARGKKKR